MDSNDLIVGEENCPIRIIIEILLKYTIIEESWTQLAHGLGIPYAEIKKLKVDYRHRISSFLEVLYEIFHSWTGRRGNKALLRNLIQVVEENCQAGGCGESLRIRFGLRRLEIRESQLNFISCFGGPRIF